MNTTDSIPNTKHCSKCGDTKPLTEFRKSSHYKDGYRSQCTLCLRAYAKQYGIDNRAKRTEQKRIRYWKKRGREPKPRTDPNATSKACTKCGVVKPFSDFDLNPSHRDGRRSECKSCQYGQAGSRPKTKRARLVEMVRDWNRNRNGITQ